MAHSEHHLYLKRQVPGVHDHRMQMGSIPALLIMQRADVHLLSPPLAVPPCSLYFLDLYRSPLPPLLSLTYFKETPQPSKSAILLGAYG